MPVHQTIMEPIPGPLPPGEGEEFFLLGASPPSPVWQTRRCTVNNGRHSATARRPGTFGGWWCLSDFSLTNAPCRVPILQRDNGGGKPVKGSTERLRCGF